jgi:hypothetical protein
LKKGLGILDEISCMYPLYENTSIELIDDNYYWKDGADLLALHPFVQKGSYDDMPYLFQGMYDNKLKAKFINTILGDETIASENNAIDKRFIRINFMG